MCSDRGMFCMGRREGDQVRKCHLGLIVTGEGRSQLRLHMVGRHFRRVGRESEAE